jgi:pentatricopeptide repeat protein
MKGGGICPDVVVYSPLMHGLCSMDEWEEAKGLFIEMMDHVSRYAAYCGNIQFAGRYALPVLEDGVK